MDGTGILKKKKDRTGFVKNTSVSHIKSVAIGTEVHYWTVDMLLVQHRETPTRLSLPTQGIRPQELKTK